jgi:hypothetical protein
MFYKRKTKASIDSTREDDYNPITDHALIRGSFRGKGKHSVWIDSGSIVAVADTGVGLYEIMAVLTRDELKEISKQTFIHPHILTGNSVETKTTDVGFDFDGNSSDDETPVVEKKDKPERFVERQLKDDVHEDEIDIDEI